MFQMAALEIPGNGETGNYISQESIQKTLDSLEDPLQKVGIIDLLCSTQIHDSMFTFLMHSSEYPCTEACT